MGWTTPKTNWVATDKFNATDYNRIVGNLLSLQTQAYQLYGLIPFEPMETEKTFASMLYAREFNAIEENLTALNEGTYNFNIGEEQTYYSNQPTPTYVEFNRIESACATLKQQLDVDMAMLPFLPLVLGGAKTFGKRVSA